MDSLNLQDIGIRLKHLRTSHQLTIERLAELIDASASFIGLIEKGQSGVSIDNLYKLSQIFDVSTDYILIGSPDRPDRIPRFARLNSALYDYTETEIEFIIELSNLIKKRTVVKP